MKPGRRHSLWVVLIGAALAATAGVSWASWRLLSSAPDRMPDVGAVRAHGAAPVDGRQELSPQRRTFEVVARRYSFSPGRIEVQEGDLVKIIFSTQDIPHSFTIDEPLRIAKRATPGQAAVFEFRAAPAGTYTFYCNLTAEEGCKKMRGELIIARAR